MTTLIASVADAVLVLAIGHLAVWLLRRQSAALRHAVLASTVACACAMPLFEILLPSIPVARWSDGAAVLSSSTVISSDLFAVTSGGPVTPAAPAVSPVTVAALVWIAGAIVLCGGLLTGFLRLARITSRCAPADERWQLRAGEIATQYGIRRPVAVLQSEDPCVLVAFGFVRPRIILPAGAPEWDDERRTVVLRHELAHIRRHDAAIQLAAEVLRAVQWINPLAWLTCRRLRQESEYACDDAVLRGGVPATDYATHLLDIARRVSAGGRTLASAPAIAHPSTLERRIVAMLHGHRNRTPLTPRGWALATAVALAISIPLAAAGVAPADEPVVAATASPDVILAVEQAAQDPPPPPPPPQRLDLQKVGQGPGIIIGIVVDQTGAVVPGVQMTLTGKDSKTSASTMTDATGRFEFKRLEAGQYELKASLPGFATVINTIKLKAGEKIDGKLTMVLGTIQETMTIKCATSPIASLVDALVPTLHAQDMPPPPPPAPIRVGGNVKAPTKVKDVRPSCPAAPAADTVVRLVGRIGTDGIPFDVKPEPTSTVPREFAEAAIAAVNQWVFTPTLLNRQPMEIGIKVQVTFTR